MESDRLNSPDTCVVTVEILGHELQFAQDPNSKHLGTTVWDASLVLVKFLEKNSRKGKFSSSKLKGKRVIELGAGCGVAGFGMALLGCDVVATDQVEVLPLLRRNVEWNTSRIHQSNPGSFGSIQVAELDWGNKDHIKAVNPPFDYIIGTDVVYAEHLLELLLQTISVLSGPKTSILLGYEIRSTSVHEQMLQMWKQNFNLKIVPQAKMHDKYQHSSIQLFIMGPKPSLKRVDERNPTESVNQKHEAADRIKDKAEEAVKEERPSSSSHVGKTAVDDSISAVEASNEEDGSILQKLKDGKLSDWEARRYGSIAARLLRDVKINY